MSFTEDEERHFAFVATQLPRPESHRQAGHEDRDQKLSSLLSQEQMARFEDWQSDQRAKRFAASFDPRNTPTPTQLVNALKNIDFAIDSTFDAFQKTVCQFSNAPRIPIIRTPLHEFTVRLGDGLGSAASMGLAMPPAENVVSTEFHKYAERFAPDPIGRSLRSDPIAWLSQPPAVRSWQAWKYHLWDTFYQHSACWRSGDHLEASPIEYGFCIGQILGSYLGDKIGPARDTNFVLILSARDRSLWMIHNYYALDEDGSPVQWTPVEMSGLVDLINIPRDGVFDCLRILDHVNDWNPDKPLAEILMPVPPPPLRDIVARPANKQLLAEYVAAHNISPS